MAPYYDEGDEVTWQGCTAAAVMLSLFGWFLTYHGMINW